MLSLPVPARRIWIWSSCLECYSLGPISKHHLDLAPNPIFGQPPKRTIWKTKDQKHSGTIISWKVPLMHPWHSVPCWSCLEMYFLPQNTHRNWPSPYPQSVPPRLPYIRCRRVDHRNCIVYNFWDHFHNVDKYLSFQSYLKRWPSSYKTHISLDSS